MIAVVEAPLADNLPKPMNAARGRHLVTITAAITVLTALVMFVLFVVASRAVLPGDASTYRARIAHGFAKGDLVENPYQQGSTTIGSHQWNDCLIMLMAVDQRGDLDRLALSPILMDLGPSPSVTTNPCAVLSAVNKGAVPNSELYYYDRYPHGAVVLLRYLLPHASIRSIRHAYRSVLTAVLIVSLGLALVGLARRHKVGAFALIAVTSVALMRYFGLESFSQSLGHGPADAVLGAYLAALAAIALWRTSFPAAILAAATFGALTIIFELFTGGVPLGLAMAIGLTPLVVGTVRPAVAAAAAGAAFVGAGAIFYLLKMAAVIMLAGGGIATDALSEVLRLSILMPHGVLQDGTGFAVAIRETRDSIGVLTAGMGSLAVGTIALALGSGAYGLVRIWKQQRSPVLREQALVLALSLAITPLWCLFFLNLMIQHAWFTDRIFVWLIAGGFGLFFLAVSSADADASERTRAADATDAQARKPA